MADAYPIDVLSTSMQIDDLGLTSDVRQTRKIINDINTWMQATGIAPMDLYAIGGTDSDKLDAAIAHQANLSPNRTARIGMTNRYYQLNRSIGKPYDGFHWEGIGKGQLGIISGTASTTKKNHTTLRVEVPKASSSDPAGYFINATTQGRDWYIGGFNAHCDTGLTQMYRAPYIANVSAGLGECNFVDQTYQGFYSIFGNSAEAISFTICDIYGGWGIFETRDTGVHLRGSDCRRIFSDGVDIYNSGKSSNPGLGKWMMMFTALGKSSVGGIYLTCWGGWRGIKVYGSASTGLIDFSGMVVEGNNQDEMGHAGLMRFEGAVNAAVVRSTFDDGMANPILAVSPYANTAGKNSNGIADRGLIEIIGTDAQVDLDKLVFAHGNQIDSTGAQIATGVPLTTPVVYNESPWTIAKSLRRFSRTQAWGSQLPVVKGVQPLVASDGTWQFQAA